ncbi:hypothetical protein PZA11_004069 [Diplocarpon coronariae]
MSSRGNERQPSSIAPLQPQVRSDNVREEANGRVKGRSRVGSPPKTPQLLSSRLHMPHLPRSRANSLPLQEDSTALPSHSLRSFRHPFTSIVSRPSTSQRQQSRRNSRESPFPGARQPSPGRRPFGVDPAEGLVNQGRQRRQKVSRIERTCGPNFKDTKARVKIANCFFSGIFLTLLLTIYLSMVISERKVSEELHILLILVILATTAFFCHAMIRLCMLLLKPFPPDHEDLSRYLGSQMVGPGGYAEPFAPIPVTLARDEEAVGIESEATKFPPPAYGLWRESVRVDPNRIFWQRNENSPPPVPQGQVAERQAVSRPPSYMSDDGVEYVVDAAPRSVAPTTEIPLPSHLSD